MTTKSILASKTVWASFISLGIALLKIVGVESLDRDETVGLVDHLMAYKEEVLVMVASIGSIWSRIVATDFNKSVYKTKTFWFKIGQGVGFILQAFGAAVDPAAAADLAVQVFSLVTDGAGLGAVAWGIFGRVKANQPVRIVKAEPVDD